MKNNHGVTPHKFGSASIAFTPARSGSLPCPPMSSNRRPNPHHQQQHQQNPGQSLGVGVYSRLSSIGLGGGLFGHSNGAGSLGFGQSRTSFGSTVRTSLAAGGRPSAVGGTAASAGRQSIGKPAQRQRVIEELAMEVWSLLSQNFPASEHGLTMEVLCSPTRNVIRRIVLLTLNIQLVDHDLERVLPKILRDMQCPVDVKSSTIQTSSAPQSVPTILEMFLFLLTSNEYFLAVNTQQLLFIGGPDGNTTAQRIGIYTQELARRYSNNRVAEVNRVELHELLRAALLQMKLDGADVKSRADELQFERATHDQRSAAIARELEEIKKRQHEMETLELDAQELKQQIHQKAEHLKQLKAHGTILDEDVARAGAEKDEAQAKLDALRAEIAADQDGKRLLSGDAARKLVDDVRRWEQKSVAVARERDELSANIWTERKDIDREVDELQSRVDAETRALADLIRKPLGFEQLGDLVEQKVATLGQDDEKENEAAQMTEDRLQRTLTTLLARLSTAHEVCAQERRLAEEKLRKHRTEVVALSHTLELCAEQLNNLNAELEHGRRQLANDMEHWKAKRNQQRRLVESLRQQLDAERNTSQDVVSLQAEIRTLAAQEEVRQQLLDDLAQERCARAIDNAIQAGERAKEFHNLRAAVVADTHAILEMLREEVQRQVEALRQEEEEFKRLEEMEVLLDEADVRELMDQVVGADGQDNDKH